MKLLARIRSSAAAGVGLTVVMASGPALAFGVGDAVGTTVSEIAEAFEDKGYEIREIDVSSNVVEVEASLEGKRLEFDIDRNTGSVVKVDTD
ncbi:YpeB-like protein with putative protease inhibitory function [Roseibium hamelinense]|uniref:YpeB-like protein with putative protease inhibitory function n=1 Tax=Roseibium hamelinense TaxID=150831 RepID=A0A562TBR4_9HYPH|nr:PepSY domain-containing protein [Roseibium hamelinense]MTI45153.1 PepSY domain-containing protein [Roseibium hamelinense]TWI90486.1 YpeB-like protein with putative protease inhibitory function [Roseibium hamelinense]